MHYIYSMLLFSGPTTVTAMQKLLTVTKLFTGKVKVYIPLTIYIQSL